MWWHESCDAGTGADAEADKCPSVALTLDASFRDELRCLSAFTREQKETPVPGCERRLMRERATKSAARPQIDDRSSKTSVNSTRLVQTLSAIFRG